MIDTQEYTTRQQPVRVVIDATTTRPPGHRRTWTAEAGRWHADGTTEKAATTALAANLKTFLDTYRPPTVLAFRGYVAVLSVDLGDGSTDRPSWEERVVHPDGHISTSFGGAESWDEAEAGARCRLAHMATDWHDDASVHAGAAYLRGADRIGYGQYGPAEFLRYAAWQRAAKAAMDAGRDDWHRWAGEHATQFAVPDQPADVPTSA
jgi:hypothetical protein